MSEQTTDIPARGTKEFALYRAGVDWEAENGAYIEGRYSPVMNPRGNWDWGLRRARGKKITDSEWEYTDFRVRPEPPVIHPIDQWRAMSPEERKGKVIECKGYGGTWMRSSYNENPEIDQCGKESLTYQIRDLTLAERNAEIRADWEAMTPTESKSVRKDASGKLCTWRCRLHSGGAWANAGCNQDLQPMDGFEYRITELPAPKFIPWTRETCPVGSVVRRNDNRQMIVGAGECNLGAWVGWVGWVEYHDLLNDWTMEDGSKCGTEVAQ